MLRSGGNIPRFDTFLQRAAGFGLRCLLVLWLFGQAVRLLTDFAWYNALGYLPLWRGIMLAKGELFLAFIGVALLLGLPVLRAARHPAGEGAPARAPFPGQWSGALGKLNRWRRRIPGALFWLMVLEALLLARGLAGHADEWLLFTHAGQWGYAEPHTGWDASFWVFKLPVLSRWLGAVWLYSVTLWVALLVGGGLRALPLVLKRKPAMPHELLRVVYRLGVWLLLLRSAGYVLGALEALGQLAPDSHAWWLLRLTAGLGAVGCLAMAFLVLSRQPAATNNSAGNGRMAGATGQAGNAFVKLVLPVLAVLWLPSLTLRLLGPWAENATATDPGMRQAAVHAAWGPVQVRATPDLKLSAAPWPAWDEAALLQANPSGPVLNRKVTVWQRAGLEWDGAWKMLIAGIPSGSTLETDPRDAGETNSQIFVEGRPGRVGAEVGGEGLPGASAGEALAIGSAEQVSSGSPTAVFGLDSGWALVAKGGEAAASHGVPYRSLFWRLAWTWRLRDLFLAYGNGEASALLAYRSAEERAQRLLPFLRPCGPAHAERIGGRIFWVLDLATASSQFPGVPDLTSGLLQGNNQARQAVKMMVDSGTGAVSFFMAPAAQELPDPALRAWMRAFPGVIRPAAERPVGRAAEFYPTSLLEARAWQESGGQGGYGTAYPLGGEGGTANGSASGYLATWSPRGEGSFNWLAADGTGQLQSVQGRGAVEEVRTLLANCLSEAGGPTGGAEAVAEGASPTAPPGQRGVLPKSERGFHPRNLTGLLAGARTEPAGGTVLWPVLGAGGGWMLARAQFVTGSGGLNSEVATADLAARLTDNPLRAGVGPDLGAALSARERSMGPVLAPVPPADNIDLVRRALEANAAIGNDFQQNNMADIGRQLQAQRQWLQQYLQRKGAGTPANQP